MAIVGRNNFPSVGVCCEKRQVAVALAIGKRRMVAAFVMLMATRKDT